MPTGMPRLCHALTVILMVGCLCPALAQPGVQPVDASVLGDDAAAWNRRSVELARHQPELARQHAETALRLAEQQGLQAVAAMAHVNIGRAFLLLGDYPDAVRSMQTGLGNARQHAGAREIAVAAESLAVAFDRIGLYEQSLRLHQEALQQFESANDLERMAQVLVNLGNLYDNLEQTTESRAHYLRALALLDRIGAENGRASIYNNLSQLTGTETTVAESLGLLDRAISLYRQENNQIGLGLAHRNRASLLIKAGRLPEAEAAVTEAMAIAKATQHRVGLAAAEEAFAELHIAMASQNPAHPSAMRDAGLAIDRAVALATALDEPDRLERLLVLAADWHERQQEPSEALQLLRRANELRRTREQVLQSQRLQALSAQYQSEQQQAELRRWQAEAATHREELVRTRWQRNGSIILVGLLVALALVGRQWIKTRDRLLSSERAQNAALQQTMADLAQAHRRAEEAQRISGELLALAAHDVQGSLSRVASIAERLLGSTQFSPESRSQIASIATTANEVVDTIANLVTLTTLERSPQSLQRSEFDLAQLLDDLVTQAQGRAAEKRLRLSLIRTPDVLPIQADRLRLAEAIEQLIGNAIKFSPPNRRIEVQAIVLPEVVRVEVHDEGPGLSEADQRRAFGRFQRLSARPTGGERSTGLGLALVKQIAEAHGGRAGHAASRLQQGVCFFVELPMREPQTEDLLATSIA